MSFLKYTRDAYNKSLRLKLYWRKSCVERGDVLLLVDKHIRINGNSVLKDCKEKLSILLPQAEAFHQDTLNRLFPIQLEYTVGIEEVIAGNVDMLCWNQKAQEFQIWDYKNLKNMTITNNFGQKGKGSFNKLPDCHLVKYSIQLNIYKAIIQRQLGIQIGKCYLVHFNSLKQGNDFDIYECYDLQRECNIELDRLVSEVKNGN